MATQTARLESRPNNAVCWGVVRVYWFWWSYWRNLKLSKANPNRKGSSLPFSFWFQVPFCAFHRTVERDDFPDEFRSTFRSPKTRMCMMGQVLIQNLRPKSMFIWKSPLCLRIWLSTFSDFFIQLIQTFFASEMKDFSRIYTTTFKPKHLPLNPKNEQN